MKNSFMFSLLFCVTLSLNAQWTSYTTANGLVHNEVYGIHVGLDGVKWFGTVGGLSKLSASGIWTSYKTSNSDLPVNYVYPVLKDSNGNLWIGTRGGGVVKYSGTSFVIYESQLPSDIVRCLFEDKDGNIWLGTGDAGWAGGGVAKYDGFGWTKYSTANGLAANTVRGIVQDNQDNLWFATTNGLSKFNGINWTTYNVSNTSNGLTNNDLTGIAIDLTGKIWVCTWGGGVCVYNPVADTWSSYTTSNSDISSNNILCIAVDRFRNIWLGTLDLGLNYYSYSNNSWSLFTTADGLPHNKVNVIFIDEQDGVWVGTNGGVATNNPTVGLNNSYNKQDHNIFPNPVSDKLYLENFNADAQLLIYDAKGSIIYSTQKLNEIKEIDLKSLPEGIYLISIKDKDYSFTKKIIKIK